MAAMHVGHAMRTGSAVYVGSTLVPVALMTTALSAANAMHPYVVKSAELLE